MQTNLPFRIKVNSSKTGSGKSTAIRATLEFNTNLKSPSILAVPSKELQYEYMDSLTNTSVQVSTINKDTVAQGESVSKTFIQSLYMNDTISITHEALKLIDHRSIDVSLYRNRDIIIDEAFNPLWCKELSVKNSTKNKDADDFIKTDWESWLNPTGNVINGFVELRPREQKTISSIYDLNFIRTVQNPNFKVYISQSNWDSLIKNDADKINLFGVFDTDILRRFKSVHISSAAFDTTLLGILLKKQGVDVDIIKKYEKQQEKFIFHVATNNGKLHSHSKKAIKAKPANLNVFRQYVDTTLNGRECLVLRNVIDTSILPSNYTKLNNNCHGINSHRHVDAISIESTYNTNTNFKAFLNEVLGFSDDEILLGITANTFYQCMMRTAARDRNNKNPIDVFIMDSKVLPLLTKHFIDNYDVKHIEIAKTSKDRVPALSHNKHKTHVYTNFADTESQEHAKIIEFIETVPTGEYLSSQLHSMYQEYAKTSLSARKFGFSLGVIGIEKKRCNRGILYKITQKALQPVTDGAIMQPSVDDPSPILQSSTLDQEELHHGKESCWQRDSFPERPVEWQGHLSSTGQGKLSSGKSKCYRASD
jgi:hypothetical protein